MSCEENCYIVFFFYGVNVVLDVCFCLWIEVYCGFIKEENFGFVEERVCYFKFFLYFVVEGFDWFVFEFLEFDEFEEVFYFFF